MIRGVHFGVCRRGWIISELCWNGMGSGLGFGLVVWGFSGVILGHFKPFIARLVGLVRGYVESTWGLA